MIVGRLETDGYVARRETVGGYIVSCLDVERFFNFGVGGNEEMEEDETRDEEGEEGVWGLFVSNQC